MNNKIISTFVTSDENIFEVKIEPPKKMSDIEIVKANSDAEFYDIYTRCKGTMEKTDISQIKKLVSNRQHEVVKETYEDYEKKKLQKNLCSSEWIYDIVDGKTEQSDIIYKDDNFVLIPTMANKQNNVFHILAIATNKKLMTLRDLRSSDIALLNHIKNTSINIIYKNFGVKENKLRVYIHYPPSAWLLHIHFTLIDDVDRSHMIEFCHNLDQVIFNLSIKDDYYANFAMQIAI